MKKQPLFDRAVPDGWQVLTVDEVKAPEKHSCVAGPFGSSISSKYFVDEGVPVIRGSNLRDDLTPFVPEGFVFVSPEQATRYKPQHVKAGDLVFTCWGTLGQVGLIPQNGPFTEYIISNKQLKLRPNPAIADARFLFYYFGSPQMVGHIRSIAIGAAVPGISLGLLKGIEVTLPPLPVQRRIASILCAYDDLIENSTRRIKILEAMAQMLYREWFVSFRFPGYEKVPMVESELGPIPDGWVIRRVVEFGTVVTGKTPSTAHAEFFGADVPFIKTPDMHGNMFCIQVDDHLSFVGAESQKNKTIPANSIIVNCIGALAGSVSITTMPAQTNQQINSLVLNDQSTREFLYFALVKLREALRSIGSNGATMINVNKSKFENLRIIKPPSDLMGDFHSMVFCKFELVRNLQVRNRNLRITRDLLLPKLMSGEVPVEAAEEALEQTA